MRTIPRPADRAPDLTQKEILTMGLVAFRDCVDQYDDLTPAKRRDVLQAVGAFLGDLRQIGATR